jgi:autotransporter-associated beta strand protein
VQINKGDTLTTTGYTFTVGDSDSSDGYIILNGGTISGSVSLSYDTHIYTDTDNGTISGAVTLGTNDYLVKDGPGTLTVGSVTTKGTNALVVNEGALDIGSLNNYNSAEIFLQGGVIQGNGTATFTLTNAVGGVIFNTGNDYSNPLGGGFSAHGGTLVVTLQDTTGNQNLVWGTTTNFLQEGSVFNFGSTTSNGLVFFENNMDLGGQGNDYSYFSRVIDVTANSSDTGDPLAYKDGAVLDGSITNTSDPYAGISKDGTGVLYLNGVNSYTGPTMIANGSLVIFADYSLGTAPTAAYALNTAPTSTGVTGNALTPGAVEINGGAALVADANVTLSSYRQMLLAGGAAGASTASIIDVYGNGTNKNYTLNYGGTIADYVNEVGSLEKQGGGTFNYSGTAYNTGSYAVTAGLFEVSGSGSINSGSGVTINTSSIAAVPASFNYASSTALTKPVTYGSGGGSFFYNSTAAYTGASSATISTKQVIGGGGNLSSLAVTIASGGTLLPGTTTAEGNTATIGTLMTGAVKLLGGGNDNFLFADMTGAAGVGYSTVDATSVDLTGLSAALPFNINLESLSGTSPGTPADLTTLTHGQNVTFLLFSTGTNGITPETQAQLNADFVVHTAANDGATGFSALGPWEVLENANDSALYLQYTAPEPSTWAMLAGGLGLLVFIRRLRSRSQ